MASILDSGNKSAAITLSGGNLTFLQTATNADSRVRATPEFRSGKWYWEATIVAVGNNGVWMFGLIYKSVAFTTGSFIGHVPYTLGWQGTGVVASNNSSLGTIQTYATGNVVCIALDMETGRVWFRTNGGNWNNNGSANPVTNVGGIPIFAGLPIMPMFSAYALNDSCTVNFGGSAFAQSQPSGFAPANTWDAPVAGATRRQVLVF